MPRLDLGFAVITKDSSVWPNKDVKEEISVDPAPSIKCPLCVAGLTSRTLEVLVYMSDTLGFCITHINFSLS